MKETFKIIYDKYHLKYLLLIAALYGGKLILYELSAVFNTNWSLIDMKIDDYIPFCKYFLIFYFTYYFYPPLLMYYMSYADKRKFYRLLISCAGACLIANVCFALYQVKMVRPEIIGNDIFDMWMNFTYSMDPQAVNCFPSVHAVMGTSMIIGGYKTEKFPKGFRILSIICGVGCILSTVFVKQHYFIDMIAGVILMIICYLVTLFIDKKR